MKIFSEKNNETIEISFYICVIIELRMERILYIVYLWLFFVPVFLVLTILTAVTVIIGCLLGRENLRLLSGYDLVSIDLLSGALSGDGKRA